MSKTSKQVAALVLGGLLLSIAPEVLELLAGVAGLVAL